MTITDAQDALALIRALRAAHAGQPLTESAVRAAERLAPRAGGRLDMPTCARDDVAALREHLEEATRG